MYRRRGERTGVVIYASAIKLSVCLNLVLNPTLFVIGTLECTEGNVYIYKGGNGVSCLVRTLMICAIDEIVLYLTLR